MFTVNRNPSVNDLRKFGWAMLLGFSVIAVILWLLAWRRNGGDLLSWSGATSQVGAVGLFVLGIVLCVFGVAAPSIAGPIYVAWMNVTVPIGMVMSTILLTVLFVFLLPLFSIIVRLGDPLRKRLGGPTYWEDYRHYEPTLERMKRSF